MPYRSTLAFAWLVFSATVGGFSAHAQSFVRAGSFEFGPYAGTTYGIGNFRFMAGGNVTYAINRRILPYFEYSYFPGIGTTQITENFPNGTPLVLNLHALALSDFHGGVHIRLPIHESPIVPYIAAGFGALRNSTKTINLSYMAFGQTVTQSLIIPANSNPDFNAGAGLRYYLNQRFGIRAEAKGYKPFHRFIGPNTQVSAFGKVELGFFYQLR
jgi:hypothetical protein